MKAIKFLRTFSMSILLGSFLSLYAGGQTEIDGDIVASTLTVTGPVSMSSITVTNNLIVSSGVATNFSVSSATITNLQVAGNIIPGGIVGVTNGSDASPGNVGEQVLAVNINLTNVGTAAQWNNLLSVSLSSGDWDVSGSVILYRHGATISGQQIVYLSQDSGSTTTDAAFGYNQMEFIPPIAGTTDYSGGTIPSWRLSVPNTTTVYLKMYNEGLFDGNALVGGTHFSTTNAMNSRERTCLAIPRNFWSYFTV